MRPKGINDTRTRSKATACRERFHTLWKLINRFESVSVSHRYTKAYSKHDLFSVSIGGVETKQAVFVEGLSRDLKGRITVSRTTVVVDVMVQDAPKLFLPPLTCNEASTQLYIRYHEPLVAPLVWTGAPLQAYYIRPSSPPPRYMCAHAKCLVPCSSHIIATRTPCFRSSRKKALVVTSFFFLVCY